MGLARPLLGSELCASLVGWVSSFVSVGGLVGYC